jgi:hypothetical protein
MTQKPEWRKVYNSFQNDLRDEDRIKTENFRHPIRHICTTAEIVHPVLRPVEDDSDGYPCLRIVKCGRTTGWTIAEAGGIKSDCQRTMGTISTEMFIPDPSPSAPFSAVGDSGAIIFDFRGRAVGMIHGGNVIQGSNEKIASYATPIEDLFEDIQQQLGVTVTIA